MYPQTEDLLYQQAREWPVSLACAVRRSRRPSRQAQPTWRDRLLVCVGRLFVRFGTHLEQRRADMGSPMLRARQERLSIR